MNSRLQLTSRIATNNSHIRTGMDTLTNTKIAAKLISE